MKKHKLPFALSEPEITIVRAISNYSTLSVREISGIAGKSESSVSQGVKGLLRNGIVRIQRKGMKKYIEISDRNYAISLLEMIKARPYIPWEKILSNSNIAILFNKIMGENTFDYGLSRASLWRGIRNLSMYGMLNRDDEEKLFMDRYLWHFISEYFDHVSMKYLLEKLPKDAIIIWRDGYRCLYRIRDLPDKESKKFPSSTLHTGVSALPDYGIQLMTSDSYFYYGPKLESLSVEDIIIHTLLVDPLSQIYATYALLLAFKVKYSLNLALLSEKSRSYKLEDEVSNLIKYLKSLGKIREWPLPKIEEFQEQADLYGIVIN